MVLDILEDLFERDEKEDKPGESVARMRRKKNMKTMMTTGMRRETGMKILERKEDSSTGYQNC